MTTISEPPAVPLSREMAEAAMREAVLNLTDDLAMRDRHDRFLDIFSRVTGNH